ncbi:chromosome partitioning protein ParB [Clostridium botulinum]|uniref:nucleoid occlusion protein n=1 Tax=Clostridium botulinum TaxID=1491 RepID=UPI0004D48233|nr:nucleoid occlusion protein [Clostridium botulinum]KEI01991.1 chromosome partitioning protein ParB [Clostridium botulinum C/D str. BKT75002]KEI10093.1 chromosome partitioning protein ParB [Clostridium botulinum C/D str. BKT2873]KGM98153.1 chromosome partitioning protein ParB [Clostridium botulinum D str. CCUG 7971]KOC50363.1 chromosome partitioning protein ParB [Clostridium botulinum]KOC54618.1 chromosome partitioning protein ParB [Clostridium botulinum]
MKKDVEYISTDIIIPNAYQPRKYFNEETIDELGKSIKNYGIIQPLSVRKLEDNKYELIAGERRFRAATKIGLKEVPVIVIDICDKDSAAIALLENIQREDLSFLEEAEAYYNLIQEHEYTQSQLASIIGKKQSTIANKLRILKLDEEIRKSVLENNLTERHARALLKLPTKELQKKVLKIVIKRGLNVKKTEELINKELLKLAGKELASDGKKKIKGIFAPRVYVNTVKQVFDKYGVQATYRTKDSEDKIQVIINIPKK